MLSHLLRVSQMHRRLDENTLQYLHLLFGVQCQMSLTQSQTFGFVIVHLSRSRGSCCQFRCTNTDEVFSVMLWHTQKTMLRGCFWVIRLSNVSSSPITPVSMLTGSVLTFYCIEASIPLSLTLLGCPTFVSIGKNHIRALNYLFHPRRCKSQQYLGTFGLWCLVLERVLDRWNSTTQLLSTSCYFLTPVLNFFGTKKTWPKLDPKAWGTSHENHGKVNDGVFDLKNEDFY